MISRFVTSKIKAFVPHHIPNHAVLSFLTLLSWRVPDRKTAENSAHNLRVLSEAANAGQSFYQRNAYIENQRQWDSVKFGSYTMAYSGCEILAVYNALLSLGNQMDERDMAALISRFEAKGAVLSGGFGVSPAAVHEYFKELGYHTQMTADTAPETINELGRVSDTVILTVYNDVNDLTAQIHTVDVSKDERGIFYLHNGYKLDHRSGREQYAAGGPYTSLWNAVRDVAGGKASPVCLVGIGNKK